MEITVSVETDSDDLSEVIELLSSLEGAVDTDIQTEDQQGPSMEDLSEEEKAVLWALQKQPGCALRVVHSIATGPENSPFNDYEGWNDERQRVQEILWDLRGELTMNDGQLWYPTEDAPQIELS